MKEPPVLEYWGPSWRTIQFFFRRNIISLTGYSLAVKPWKGDVIEMRDPLAMMLRCTNHRLITEVTEEDIAYGRIPPIPVDQRKLFAVQLVQADINRIIDALEAVAVRRADG